MLQLHKVKNRKSITKQNQKQVSNNETDNNVSYLLFWVGLGLLIIGLCLQFLWLPNAPDSAFNCNRSSNEMCSLGIGFTYLFTFWAMDIVGFFMMIICVYMVSRRQKRGKPQKTDYFFLITRDLLWFVIIAFIIVLTFVYIFA